MKKLFINHKISSLKQINFSLLHIMRNNENIWQSDDKKGYPIKNLSHILHNSGEKIYCLKNK